MKCLPKTQTEALKRISKKRYVRGRLDDETVEAVYSELALIVDPRLYPTMEAISNDYQEALRQDAESRKVNPLSLWNMNYVRRIDDSGLW